MSAYYNECDPFKAEVLRQAISARAIAVGDVDERSIADVQPDDLRGYSQWHFFAGGGFWSCALRGAGWPDDRPVATLSCPCPSFSAAGKGKGFDDPRHLWPHAFRLIRECRFLVCFGEQVAAAIGHGWLDLVCGDLEAEGYAVAAAVLGAHSVGAPHIRQRLYFCADSERWATERRRYDVGAEAGISEGKARQRQRIRNDSGAGGVTGNSSNADGGQSGNGDIQRSGEQRLFAEDCGTGGSADAASVRFDIMPEGSGGQGVRPAQEGHGWKRRAIEKSAGGCDSSGDNPVSPRLEGHFGDVREWRGPGWLDPLTARSVAEAGATRGFWADCDWWYGRDEKYRPAGPGIFPLAHGSPARVGRLRMYGDAIVVPAAQAFIESCLETEALSAV